MVRINKKLISVLVALALLVSIAFTMMSVSAAGKSTTNNAYSGTAPKYVFMFIGDGMSYSQVNSAEIFKGKTISPDSKTPVEEKLSFSNFPVAGACTTYDASSVCPDSASTATSYSTGNKTLSGVINMDTSKQKKFTTITEMAKAKGYKVGIISSVSLNHATPAAYYAHQASRSNYYDIGLELANSKFDYFAGGGFLQPTGKEKDKPAITDIAKKNGFKVVNTKSDFLALNNKSGRVIANNATLDDEAALPYDIDRSASDLSLADYTKKGIEVLDNPKGFFMMVEGGKIDWACHANDAATSIKDTLAFEKSVNEAIAFYNKHPKETLIIVTGDHETGGLTIGYAATGYSTFFEKIGHQTKSFTEFDKIVADYRTKTEPGNASLGDLLPAIKSSFGLITASDDDADKTPDMVLTDYEVQRLKDALQQSIYESKDRTYNEAENVLYGTYEPLTVTLTHILNNKAGLAWTSYSHTAVPVPVFAMGAGQDLFNGYYDNTDVFKKTTAIMKLK